MIFLSTTEADSSRHRFYFSLATVFLLFIGLFGGVQELYLRSTSNDQCAWLPIEGRYGLSIQEIVPGGVTDVAGLKNGDVLLKINGEYFRNQLEAQALINGVKNGDQARYLVDRGGMLREFRVRILKIINIVYLSEAMLGFCFLIVATFIVVQQPRGQLQRWFYFYSCIVFVVFSTSPNSVSNVQMGWNELVANSHEYRAHFRRATVVEWITALLWVIAMALSHLAFLGFFFRFPTRSARLSGTVVNSVLFLTGVAFFLGVLLPIPHQLDEVHKVLLMPEVLFCTGLLVLFFRVFRGVERNSRQVFYPILVGAVVCVLALIYLFIVRQSEPFAVFLKPWVLAPAAFCVALPLGFGYSIFRFGLMDIDIVVRRSLTYGVITALVICAYLTIVFLVGGWVDDTVSVYGMPWVSLIAIILIAFLLEPAKRRAQDGIDRLFFREKLNYQRALLEFSREIPKLSEVNTILDAVRRQILTYMHVESVAFTIFGEIVTMTKSIEFFDDRQTAEGDTIFSLLSTHRRPLYFSPLGQSVDQLDLNNRERQIIQHYKVVLSVPMINNDFVIAALNIGRKLNGRNFSQEDIELLTTIASQTAIALENARLRQAEVKRLLVEEELSLARTIQRGLMPAADPLLEGFEIASHTNPAFYGCGDYFDFVKIDEHRLLVVVADVAGKGMSAALYMAKLQGMIEIAAHQHSSPKEVLTIINRHLYDLIQRSSFITACMVLLDSRTHTIHIARAGHTLPLHKTGDSVRLLRSGGLAMGLVQGERFNTVLEEQRLDVVPGDYLILYTDGVTESINIDGEQFGDHQLVKLAQSIVDESATAIRAMIIEAMRTHRKTAEVNDDVTFVVIKRTQADSSNGKQLESNRV